MTITAAIFSGDEFFGTQTYKELPRCGDFVQLKYQKVLGFQVRRVTFLDSNSENWDVVLHIHSADVEKLTVSAFYKAYYSIGNKRRVENERKARDRSMVKEPNAVWQRRKNLYERVEAGESVEAIAAELGIKVTRVKSLISDWRRLLIRVSRYEDTEKPRAGGDDAAGA